MASIEDLTKGTDVVATVDGSEWDGKVIRTYVEEGVEMAEIQVAGDEPFWTGEYEFDAMVDDVRILPPLA